MTLWCDATQRIPEGTSARTEGAYLGHGVALGAVAVTPHPSLVYTVANTTFVTYKSNLFTNLQFNFIKMSQNCH